MGAGAKHWMLRVVNSARRLAERDGARRRGLRDADIARRLVARDGAQRRVTLRVLRQYAVAKPTAEPDSSGSFNSLYDKNKRSAFSLLDIRQ
eukprot:5445468-Pleurochrysis_carterae.AAC.1